jgi:hypothetical protein
MLRRAFDKAVRREPPAIAADAGPMQIQLWEGSVPRFAGTVRESTAVGTEGEKGEVGAEFWRRDSSRKWKDNVQDHIEQNFHLDVGSVAESVTVEVAAPLINTESAAVSTVVDRQFAENLPMNGRSFQTLIQLTPGVVLTPSNFGDGGQFSINGQRAASNYWMVDGVSANIGIGVNVTGTPGNGLAGSLGSFSALGGTNSLVSVAFARTKTNQRVQPSSRSTNCRKSASASTSFLYLPSSRLFFTMARIR